MKKIMYGTLSLLMMISLTACSSGAEQVQFSSADSTSTAIKSSDVNDNSVIHRSDEYTEPTVADTGAEIRLSDSGTEVIGSGAEVLENTVSISAGGTYTLTGTRTNGQIIINSSKDENVKLILA